MLVSTNTTYGYNSNGNILTDGTILEQNDYYPFGLRTTRKQTYITLSQSLASATAPRYLYNGKEKQEFIHNTGSLLNAAGSVTYTSNYIDYGARFYNPVTLRWTTQDPMAEKYMGYSPYNYCVNSPINFVDPNGMDLYLTGKLAQMAFEQLQENVKDYLTMTRIEETGQIIYTLNENVKKIRGNAIRLVKIIDNSNVRVDVKSQKLSNSMGGEFWGNACINDKMNAEQHVDPEKLAEIENLADDPIGTNLMHEITEAYEGALDAIKNNRAGTLRALLNPDEVISSKERRKDFKVHYKYYLKAHSKATRSTDIYAESEIDDKGKIKIKHYVYNKKMEKRYLSF